MVVSNRNLLSQGSIFRCHVSFRQGTPQVIGWMSPGTLQAHGTPETHVTRGTPMSPFPYDSKHSATGGDSGKWEPCRVLGQGNLTESWKAIVKMVGISALLWTVGAHLVLGGSSQDADTWLGSPAFIGHGVKRYLERVPRCPMFTGTYDHHGY